MYFQLAWVHICLFDDPFDPVQTNSDSAATTATTFVVSLEGPD